MKQVFNGGKEPPATPPYSILISTQTLEAIRKYKSDLSDGKAAPGARLKQALNGSTTAALTTEGFIGALLATKPPQIFAESEISGNGADWTRRELVLLGDINIAMAAKIYDNGVWSPADRNFREHKTPLDAQLLFTPGALLGGSTVLREPPDYTEVTTGGLIDQKKYNALVERRLLPLLAHANEVAATEGKPAFITLPGLGCGAFAGRFKGEMGSHLEEALHDLLDKHGKSLPNIKTVYFDPFNECANRTEDMHGISFRVRPAVKNPGKPQLCAPQDYAENGEDLSNCRLCKIVAWDHASWPGNDFFINSRMTDDGVSAAASNSMEVVTGIKGNYADGEYRPPDDYESWEEVVARNGLQLEARDNVTVVTADARCLPLVQAEKETLPSARPAPPKQ